MPLATPILETTEIAENTNSANNIAILAPGDGSQVAGAIPLLVAAQPGADGQLFIELSDVAGRLLLRQVHPFAGGELEALLPFEVSRPPMPARLTVRTLDAYGRIQAMRSVELVLLGEGESHILAAEDEIGLKITEPSSQDIVASGNLTVQGTADFYSTRPVSLQIIDRQGRILVAREIYLRDSADGTGQFETTLTLTVQEPTWLQIAVTVFGQQVPGASYFDQIEILLTP